MTQWLTNMDGLRHRIDSMTPTLPDEMTRGQIATLAVAMQMQGSATALLVVAPALADDPAALKEAATQFQKLADELIDGMG